MTTTVLPSGRIRVRLFEIPHAESQKATKLTANRAFLTAVETADFLRLSTVTLARWRSSGDGPPFLRFGRRCIYRRRDLVRWAKQQCRTSTSQPLPPMAGPKR
jgi:hypothetical protein